MAITKAELVAINAKLAAENADLRAQLSARRAPPAPLKYAVTTNRNVHGTQVQVRTPAGAILSYNRRLPVDQARRLRHSVAGALAAGRALNEKLWTVVRRAA